MFLVLLKKIPQYLLQPDGISSNLPVKYHKKIKGIYYQLGTLIILLHLRVSVCLPASQNIRTFLRMNSFR